ncbi:MAG: hypothetical protein HN842_09280 [Gammaproteobacteria bacterium]|nr:hypothetical protein [Gammaproteobacteria bacterium]MBT7308400.1 hypothetical protein [Gammaproteobacteria bacterium]
MSVRFSNDAYGYLMYDIGANDVELDLSSGGWDKFPDLSGEHFCYLSIVPRGRKKTAEIVRANSFVNGVFTIERGVDGTTPIAHSQGSRVSIRLVSASLYALRDEAVAAATSRMEAVFQLMGEQLKHHSDVLVSDVPVRTEEDLINKESLNKQAFYLNQKVDALTSVLSVVATQASGR